MDFRQRLRVAPGASVDLDAIETREDFGLADKKEGKERLEALGERLSGLQARLYAENRQALLVVFQALDAGGKDGTIRRVFSGVNPQGCHVTSFKAPSAEELDHEFLWRIHKAIPAKGMIGVFNRSHYEDVLVVRVDELVPEAVWRARYDQINAFEKLLADNRTRIVKLFLHISREEQAERFRARLADPEKHWKFDPHDLAKRDQWSLYREAFEEALRCCSTEHAPWYVIPADRKWARDVAVAQIVVDTLEEMDPRFPDTHWEPDEFVIV
jgi:PPK2 family polyphosphate:nucleotide phosphotransferase